jgi:hypothetical protein
VTSVEGVDGRGRTNIWIFYVVFVAMLLGEGFLVGVILHLAESVGHKVLGFPAAWAAFAIGGLALGEIELRVWVPKTRPDP